MAGKDAVISALPFYLNEEVASSAHDLGLHYFDLIEDLETTRHVQRIAQGANSAFMPQCGLAPGFISIAAHDLTRRFESLETVRYSGHCDQIKLLVNDLKLSERRELFKDVLETAIPMTLQDVVRVFVTVPPPDACWSSGFPSRFSPRSPDDRHSPRRALASTLHRPGRLFRRATRRRRPASAERLRRSSR